MSQLNDLLNYDGPIDKLHRHLVLLEQALCGLRELASDSVVNQDDLDPGIASAKEMRDLVAEIKAAVTPEHEKLVSGSRRPGAAPRVTRATGKPSADPPGTGG